MARRPNLSKMLHEICDHVYFQPGASVHMEYPCLVYSLTTLLPWSADNKIYNLHEQYKITAIDRNPDSQLPFELAELPFCAMDRSFANDNLHHWVFTIYV